MSGRDRRGLAEGTAPSELPVRGGGGIDSCPGGAGAGRLIKPGEAAPLFFSPLRLPGSLSSRRRRTALKSQRMASFSLGLFLGLVLAPFAANAQGDPCPSGWLAYNGHCYGYFEQEVNWQQAEAFCRSHNGHLASIQTREEHQAVSNFLQKAQWWEHEDVWLGLFLPSHSQTWTWVDGTPVGYTAWEKYDHRTWDSCAALEDSYGFLLWDDESCYDRNPFLCKSLAAAAPQGGQA